jgi:hypothetical protein
MQGYLLKRMQLTCTLRVEIPNICDGGRGKTYRSRKKCESLSPHDLPSNSRHLLDFSFVTNPKTKFMHNSNYTEHYRIKQYYLTPTKHDCTST